MTDVTAAILLKDNKILIAKRGSQVKLANEWEFPGGKVEPGESPENCLARELKEEFHIEVTIDKFFAESQYVYDHDSVRLLAYFAHLKSGEPKLLVHDELRWITIDELDQYDFAPADILIVEKLKDKH